ncbi:MAG: hypothetical protein A2289_11130 [Deltaproteobacteria bacterium RIFOXYA12_FULL_58_15]|nr:MAG: hypothetical protein A2289_11130 [Deltaproteobacteria bacterium RIFOXYA12_FULL_58_15]
MHKNRFFLVAFAALAVSCRGCTDTGPDHILDIPSANATTAVWFPEIGRLLGDADAFLGKATAKVGGPLVTRMRQAVQNQLGFDPMQAEQWSALGIDPQGGALLFTEPGTTEPILVIQLKDRGAFNSKLKQIIEKSDGANRFTEAELHGFATMTAGRPFGDEVVPVLHWAHVGRFVLLAREAGRNPWEAVLGRMATTTGSAQASLDTTTLHRDELYTRLSQKAGRGAVQLFVRATAATDVFKSNPGPLSAGAATSITLDANGFSSDTFLALDVPGIDKAMQHAPVRELAAKVEADAVFALFSRAARPEALAALRHQPQLATWLDQALPTIYAAVGLDVEREVVPLLSGPLTVSVHLADLTKALEQAEQTRSLRTLVDTVHIVVIAELEKPEAFIAALEKAKANLGKRNIRIISSTRTVGESKALVFQPDIQDPKLAWAVMGNQYIYAVGRGRLDKTLDGMTGKAGKGAGLTDALDAGVAKELVKEPGTSVMVFRLPVLAEAASTLTLGNRASALGAGAVIGTGLELLKTLGDVAIAINAEEAGLRLRIREKLQ